MVSHKSDGQEECGSQSRGYCSLEDLGGLAHLNGAGGESDVSSVNSSG